MFNIVNLFNGEANQWINIFLLLIASLRIYMEIIGFNFSELPLTKQMMNTESAMKFHRTGFYFCLGYILFFGPSTLFMS